ncbi:MAG: hypothetical protein R3F50_12660 [Gammaproteobacteria bacterium]|jgi:hypothetical protein
MIRACFLVLLFSVPLVSLQATERAPLFESDDTLELKLTAPFRAIDKERDKDEEYEGTVSYQSADGEAVVLDANFEVRGNYRLRKDICRYSQLWIDLKRGQVPDTVFAGQNRLKLVVQCRPSDRYAEYVVMEYLAYKLFNELTAPGFQVRLVNVTYDYSDDAGESRTHLGLLIENKDTIAEAVGAETVEDNRVRIDALKPESATLVALFMMLIGNTDFSLTAGPEGDECCHNAKLLDVDGGYVPIPYDFDSSGFVDASYAVKPNPAFGIRSNRQRLYRGYCYHNEVVADVLPAFNQARDGFYRLLNDPRLTSRRTREAAVEYLDEFFAMINDPAEVQDEILDDCRG